MPVTTPAACPRSRASAGGSVVGRASTRVRRGGARRLAIRLNARGRRAAPDGLRLTVLVTDPDGRSRVVYGP